jgi:hypothetical protein
MSKGSSYGPIASFSWSQTAGFPYVTLNKPDTANPQFTVPEVSKDTIYTFELTVEDDSGYSNTDVVYVKVADAQSSSE